MWVEMMSKEAASLDMIRSPSMTVWALVNRILNMEVTKVMTLVTCLIIMRMSGVKGYVTVSSGPTSLNSFDNE